MSSQHLVQCQCGAQHPVSVSQAGETLTCGCGQPVVVPALRELRQLPRVETAGPPTTSRKWTLPQGLAFAAGILLIVASAVTLLYVSSQWLRLSTELATLDRFLEKENLDDLPSSDLWEGWAAYRDFGLQWYHSAEYQALVRRMRMLAITAVVAGIAFVGGVAALAIASLWKPTDGGASRG